MAGPKYQCSGLVLGSTMFFTSPLMAASAASTSPVGATGLWIYSDREVGLQLGEIDLISSKKLDEFVGCQEWGEEMTVQ